MSTAITPSPRLGVGAAVLAAVLMAGYVVLGKQYVGGEDESGGDPGVFLICRQLLASILMTLLALVQHGPLMPMPEDHTQLHLLAVLNFINAMGFVWGFKLTSAFLCSVMQLSIPVFALTYSAIAGVERASISKVGGVLVTVAGCALVTVGGTTEGTEPGLVFSWRIGLGIGLLMMQTTCFVALVLVQKPLVARYPVPWVVGWSYILCTLWSCLAALLDGSMMHVWRAFSSPAGFAIILYSATLGCVVYFLLIAYASRHLSSTAVSVTVSLEPLAVSAIGVLLFEQTLQRLEIVGYAVAFVGSAILAFVTSEQPGPVLDNESRGSYALTQDRDNESSLSLSASSCRLEDADSFSTV